MAQTRSWSRNVTHRYVSRVRLLHDWGMVPLSWLLLKSLQGLSSRGTGQRRVSGAGVAAQSCGLEECYVTCLAWVHDATVQHYSMPAHACRNDAGPGVYGVYGESGESGESTLATSTSVWSVCDSGQCDTFHGIICLPNRWPCMPCTESTQWAGAWVSRHAAGQQAVLTHHSTAPVLLLQDAGKVPLKLLLAMLLQQGMGTACVRAGRYCQVASQHMLKTTVSGALHSGRLLCRLSAPLDI